ncbi:MAG: RecQ family ATP-dependent DNA helicase [Planctomycetota bacterium]|nr:MAG: RecQ family ATP-dependent DNA helicase [Planctomycetota bacterium]
MASAARDNLQDHLEPFGLSAFRTGQREVIETVLSDRDCLCVMPTGGGKSLCYQLPALMRPGVTLVISPLIALMKDQVDALTARGVAATFINSTLTPDEQAARLQRMAAGEFKLVYVVPERFRSSRFVEAARESQVRLLAVDEAHCVSEWGHDFRPDYARLGRFRARLGNPPTIALTATATDAVRRDVIELLNLDDPAVFITGFARPNLFYGVQVCPSDREKSEALFKFLGDNPGSGIIYASTRKRSEELAASVAARTGRPTIAYHAGMLPAQRREAQDAFMRGKAEIAVATMAFGMGIDKADVRFVVHYNLPGSLEAYYQEAGRAGRDGEPARCLLLFGGGDRNIHEFFIESTYPSRDVVRMVYEYLCQLDENPIEMTQQEVKEALGLSIGGEGVGACEKLLESAGVLERLESSENKAAVRLSTDVPTLVELLPPQAKAKRRVVRAIEQIVGSRRYEWCYFHPREVLRGMTDFDSTDLARHLRELTSLAAFEYVPPFRGRAVHMRQRDVRFDDVEIDFETLERQKAAEYERLERVLRFARDPRCRQQQILHYFGQRDAEICGHCDNCAPGNNDTRWGTPRAVTGPVLDSVRIVLSGVARVAQRRVGCGKQLLAKMLCGSSDKAVQRNRLDKLSTFGLLSHLKQGEVTQLVDALLLCGLLEQNEIERFRPIVQLTERGVDVMSGREGDALNLPLPDDVWRRLDRSAPRVSAASARDDDESNATETPADRALEARLRTWRDETARARSVPAYVVFNNATLAELARARPRSPEELLDVKGLGPAKVRQYGDELLQMLCEEEPQPKSEFAEKAENEAEPSENETESAETAEDERVTRWNAAEAAPAASAPSAVERDASAQQPSHYWTWRLLQAGFTPEECASIRSLSEEVVLDHALRAADSGWRIDAGWFLGEEALARIRQVVGDEPPGRIRPLLAKLPRGTRYEDVQLVVKSTWPPQCPPQAG